MSVVFADPGVYRRYEPGELGRDGYPAVWHKLVKHQVREQAGHRCVRCQHPYATGDGEWSACDERCTHDGPIRLLPSGISEARWRILTVHHLTGEKADLRWWNLAPLCQRCHLQIQGRVHMERVYPWPHSEWFKPYVAGYYAWVYLGEDLDPYEVAARQDELLALEALV